jgi:cytochrome c556
MVMRKTLVVALIGAMAAGAVVGGTTLALAQGDVVAQRKENRKATGAAFGAVRKIVTDKSDAKAAVPHAAKLKELEASFVKMFPAGSDKGETKALPAIWTDMAGFTAASKAADSAYDKLAVAAGSGDAAQLASAAGDVGKACAGCHDKYRAK